MKNQIVKKSLTGKGFTLIELMVALVILGILIAAGVPGMRALLDNMSARSTTNQLANSLNYARGQAVARLVNVSVCPSSTGMSCQADWSDGWVVFLDNNQNGAYDAVGDEIIRVEDISQRNANLAIGGNGGSAVINFDNLGENTSTANATVTITVGGANPKNIRVSTVGAVNINY